MSCKNIKLKPLLINGDKPLLIIVLQPSLGSLVKGEWFCFQFINLLESLSNCVALLPETGCKNKCKECVSYKSFIKENKSLIIHQVDLNFNPFNFDHIDLLHIKNFIKERINEAKNKIS